MIDYWSKNFNHLVLKNNSTLHNEKVFLNDRPEMGKPLWYLLLILNM